MATKPISPDKNVRDLIRRAEDLGYAAEKTSGGHIKLTHPEVEHPIFCSSTPSEYRALKNCESLLVRAVMTSANDKLRENPYLGDSASDGVIDPEGHLCPACLGNGTEKVFAHPQGLVAHMAKEHPAPPLEIEAWNQGFEPQPEEEDVPTESDQPQEEPMSKDDKPALRVGELEEFLETLPLSDVWEPGDLVRLAELRRAFPEYNVANAVATLKKRKSGTRLKQFGRSTYSLYTDSPPEEAPPAEKTPPSPEFEEARIYEELNRFVDGRVLLRDADGNLYQAAIEPLT